MKTLLLLISISIFSFCKTAKEPEPQKNIYGDLWKHKALRFEMYKNLPTKWEDRISSLNGEPLDYAIQMNKAESFSDIPIGIESISASHKQLVSIGDSMTPGVSNLMDQYLFGVYFCKNLGSSGLTGYVYDSAGKPRGGIMIFDYDYLSKKANDWITFKERTAFSKDTEFKLSISIEEEKNNTKENALRYIILHEFGHILSFVKGYVPNFMREPDTLYKNKLNEGIWLSTKVSSFDEQFQLRTKLQYYSESKLSLKENWQQVYPKLEKTSFPTLYSALNVDDFYADSFASYIHCIIDKRPWVLKIEKEDKVIYEMKNGITEERAKKVKEFFDAELFEYIRN